MDGRTNAGSRGERIAAEYLILTGHRIVERNYRSGHLEVDLIVEKSGCLAFIEVKTRRSDSCGSAREAVNARKLGNLRAAARSFIGAEYRRYREYRFDLIAIDLDRSRDMMVLHHLKGIA